MKLSFLPVNYFEFLPQKCMSINVGFCFTLKETENHYELLRNDTIWLTILKDHSVYDVENRKGGGGCEKVWKQENWLRDN